MGIEPTTIFIFKWINWLRTRSNEFQLFLSILCLYFIILSCLFPKAFKGSKLYSYLMVIALLTHLFVFDLVHLESLICYSLFDKLLVEVSLVSIWGQIKYWIFSVESMSKEVGMVKRKAKKNWWCATIAFWQPSPPPS